MDIAQPRLDIEAELFGFVALAGGHNLQPAARAIAERLTMRMQRIDHAATDRAQPCNCNFQRIVHFAVSKVAGSFIRIERNFFTLRAAWRMRCSFSTRATRT